MSLKLGGAWIGLLSLLVAVASEVRGDAPDGRYQIESGTVKDRLTGLTWQQTADVDRGWADAKTYCEGLSLNGSGWRLPALKELLTLIDPKRTRPAIDPTNFPGTESNWFWTASPNVGAMAGTAWAVDFVFGGSQPVAFSVGNTVRCVR